MGCASSLDADHTGVICQQDHHVCAECSVGFVDEVLKEPDRVPVKCMICSCDIVPATFERQLNNRQLQTYATYCTISGAELQEGEELHRCPFCPNMVILTGGKEDIVFNCTNIGRGGKACGKASCKVCNKELTRRNHEDHLLRCGSSVVLRNETLQVINRASKCRCPGCGHEGQKDDNCTSILCPACRLKWCYVCEQAAKNWGGDEWTHNQNWENDANRCPMYLNFINTKNPAWPADNHAALAHFHERRILWSLRAHFERAGQESVDEMLRHFPETIAPYTLPAIRAATMPRDF